MVRTRSQKSEDRLPPETSLDSDSDAPEEIALASSRKKAAQDRKQQKESIQEKKQIRKEKNRKRVEDKKNKPSESPLQAEHAGPEQEDQLDLLPDDILQAVAAEDGDANTYSSEEDEEQNDRRIAERRIVTEQLRQGLKKSKRKAFLEQVTAGPVTVKVLHSQSGAMAYNQTADPKMTAQATSFLHQNLYGRHKRSKDMLRPATLPSSGKKQKFVYFS